MIGDKSSTSYLFPVLAEREEECSSVEKVLTTFKAFNVLQLPTKITILCILRISTDRDKR